MTTEHHITVVDDEQDILDSYVDLLGSEHKITCFSDPREFIRTLKETDARTPDLVITDLKMPGLDGIEMIRQAQALQRHFPVILLSGHLDKSSSLRAIDIGVYRILEKPSSDVDLFAAIDQLLIEHDVYMVRKEIRTLTAQLRELYTSLRMVVMPYLPDELRARMVVDAPQGLIKEKMSFDSLLDTMEARLDQLLSSEKVLTEIRGQKFRK